MKKSFRDRIEVIESQPANRQANEPVTFFDEERSMAMQIIEKELVVPAPMIVEH